MKKTLLIVCLVILTACGRGGGHMIQDIQACISHGGTPQYTSDKYGNVVSYFGCVKP